MTLRVGLVGSGHWARTVHGTGLAACPEVALVGVWGRDPGRTGAAARELGVAPFASFEALLAAVDAVDFAVPPDVQAPLALAAAEAGRYLLLEKPVATAPAAAALIADAVARRRLASVVFFTRRFVPAIEAAIGAAARESWRTARVRVHSGAMLPGSPFSPSPWRQAPGAALWDIGPHALSILVPVLGAVEVVRAARAGQIVSLRTIHAGGATAEISLSLHAAPADAATEYSFASDGRRAILPDPPFARPEALARAAGELAALAAAGGFAHRCDAAFGRDVTLALAAAERSIATGADQRVAARHA